MRADFPHTAYRWPSEPQYAGGRVAHGPSQGVAPDVNLIPPSRLQLLPQGRLRALDEVPTHVVCVEAQAEVEQGSLTEGHVLVVGQIEEAEHELPSAAGGDGERGVLVGALSGGL